ncbi:FAD/NAD(P)-binding protein [Nocardia sp. 2]|uniref:FAD/NAD(P)-binding protein n=1 Tax=Nocardia acididurans TaxID=2802282 RepID=A0ABS1MDH7_9NOCA|nr:FAD/NAD(P)-binding protein [Nocardia acididurans]MBL1078319.1 FAD/NAD(P)-binding protein [Nocardia acididurans]
MNSPTSPARIPVRALNVAIIGAGPRGTVTLERLCANATQRPERPIHIHVIDPYEHGPGRVWRRDQPRQLLMNSVAADITAFPDDSVRCAGPITTGPTQYEWAKTVAMENDSVLPMELRAEARAMRPWSYPSRALHGEYLRWAFTRIERQAPEHVMVTVYRSAATDLTPYAERGGGYRVALGDGRRIRAEAVVLAVGHYDLEPSKRNRELADAARRAGRHYVPPGNASDADLRAIGSGTEVIVYGLGLTFFDHVALLTTGRGGRFEERAGELEYLPSGAEPRIYAASRQGVPYRARPEYREQEVPSYRPRYFTGAFADRLAARSERLDFRADVWPTLRKEMAWAYYRTLLHADPGDEAVLREVFDAPGFDIDRLPAVLEGSLGLGNRHLDWSELLTPGAGRSFASTEIFGKWLRGLLEDDYAAAARGPDRDPGKALAAAVRDLRGVVRRIVSHGGVGGQSYRRDIELWFNGVNNMLASGPPNSRVAELIALQRAGAVEFVGPAAPARFDPDIGLFSVESAVVDGSRRTAPALIESYLPGADIRRAADPFLKDLLARGNCRAYRIPDAGGGYRSGGIDVDPRTLRVIKANGRAHEQVYCFGPPLEGVQWVTASGARPRVNSPLLTQSDQIARAILGLTPAR